jgi:hypothetical protein
VPGSQIDAFLRPDGRVDAAAVCALRHSPGVGAEATTGANE